MQQVPRKKREHRRHRKDRPVHLYRKRLLPELRREYDEVRAMTPEKVNETAMAHLKRQRFRLTRQQYSTLKGQILAGEDKAAMKGLWRIIRRNYTKQEM